MGSHPFVVASPLTSPLPQLHDFCTISLRLNPPTEVGPEPVESADLQEAGLSEPERAPWRRRWA
jgi:hypothetical protein